MRVFSIFFTVALVLSCSVVALVVLEDVSLPIVMLLVVSYCSWMFIVFRWRYSTSRRGESEIGLGLPSVEEKVMENRHFSEVEKYYFRLLVSLNDSSSMLLSHIQHTLKLLGRMDDNVSQASDFAKNTELMAVNAMMSAARCGDVGRGFVSVSKDLVCISEQAEQDLKRLSNLIHGLTSSLSNVDFLSDDAALTWIESELSGEVGRLNSRSCVILQTSVGGCLRILDELYEKYESTSQLDVRWLQLGETIRRVISGLRDSLHLLLNVADNLTFDVQLLGLSEHLNRQQLVEIHEGFLQFVEQHDKMNEIIS